LDVRILIETRQRFLLASRERHRSVREHALGVSEVADDLLDAPFLGRVAESCFVLADRMQQRGCGPPLLLESIGKIFFSHEIGVALIKRWKHDNIIAWRKSARWRARMKRSDARK